MCSRGASLSLSNKQLPIDRLTGEVTRPRAAILDSGKGEVGMVIVMRKENYTFRRFISHGATENLRK